MHIPYPHFLRKNIRLASFALACVVGSFAIGIQTAGDVQPFQLIEAGSTQLTGDVDGSGVLDIQDARLILEFAQGYEFATPDQLMLDPNQDGQFTVDDALAVLSVL